MIRKSKRIWSALLAAAITLAQPASAVFAQNSGSGDLRSHHPEHTAQQNDRAPSSGMNSEHILTSDCYSDHLICGRRMEEDLQDASGSDAAHTHSAECYGPDCPSEQGEPENDLLSAEADLITNEDYSANDVDVINHIIDNNGLNASKDAPDSWSSFVTWNTENPRQITQLDIDSRGLTGTLDVSGLSSLETLNCWRNRLTVLNISNLFSLTALNCSENKLPSLNLTGLTSLETLDCSFNELTALEELEDLSNLTYLDCSENKNLAALNLTGLSSLGTLRCYNTDLEDLNLGSLTSLTVLDCSENERLTVLDLSGLYNLEQLRCQNSNLVRLDGLENLSGLTTLDCLQNSLSGTLDVSGLSSLTYLRCSSNRLSELEGLNSLHALKSLYCDDNKLTVLDLSGLPPLDYLACANNPLQHFQTADGELTVRVGTGGKVMLSSYDKDSKSVQLTPVPGFGFIFGGWTRLPDSYTSPDGKIISFTLDRSIDVEAAFVSTASSLSNLTLSEGTLTPAFQPSVLNYTATVGYSVPSVTITAVKANPGSTVTGDTGTKSLLVGSNLFTVTVTAEDGVTKTNYTITVTRESDSHTGGGSGSGGSGGGGSGGGGGSSGGGGGSGGSGSGSSPNGGSGSSVSSNAPKPNTPVLAVVGLPASVQGGTAVGITDIQQTEAGIAKVSEDARAKTNGIAIQYDVQAPAAYDGFSIAMERGSLDRLIAEQIKYLTLNTTIADMTFQLADLQEISAQSTGTITLTAIRETGLSNDVQAAVGSRPAYRMSISFTRPDGSSTAKNFGSGSASLGLTYQPDGQEQAGSLYLIGTNDGSGTSWFPFSSYDSNSGRVIGSTGNFAIYGVGFKHDPVFSDTVSHPTGADIDFAVSRGLMAGKSSESGAAVFLPDEAVTQNTFVTGLEQLAGSEASDYQSLGIGSQAGDIPYAPDTGVTRQQMASILQKFANRHGYALPVAYEAAAFSDTDQIDKGMENAVRAIQQAGIMYAREGNRFAPNDPVTRAEAASVLRRFVEIVIDPFTAAGWVQNDSGHRLFYENNKPVTDWKEIDGKWYYFYPSGVMAADTAIDGFQIGPDGSRINSR